MFSGMGLMRRKLEPAPPAAESAPAPANRVPFFEIRTVASEDGMVALEPLWSELFRASDNHSPYQSWQWNMAWWRQFGAGLRLHIIVILQDTKPLGIAPFYVERTYHGLPIRSLRFIGDRRSDYLDFLIRAGAEEIFFQQLFEHLKQSDQPWNVIDLKDLRGWNANVAPLLRAATACCPTLTIEAPQICVSVPLPGSWQAFLESLSSRSRRHVGYERRHLSKSFAMQLQILTSPEAIAAALEEVIALYRARWSAELGRTHFDDPRAVSFAREIARQFSSVGWHRVYLLRLDGQPAAAILGYLLNGRYYAEVVAHSPAYQKYSTGSVILGMAIQDCIDNRCVEFDLLRGAEAYKLNWNGLPRRNYRIRIFRQHMIGILVGIIDGLARMAVSLRARQRPWRRRVGRPSV